MQRATWSRFCYIAFHCNIVTICQSKIPTFCHSYPCFKYQLPQQWKCFKTPYSLSMHVSSSKIKMVVYVVLETFGWVECWDTLLLTVQLQSEPIQKFCCIHIDCPPCFIFNEFCCAGWVLSKLMSNTHPVYRVVILVLPVLHPMLFLNSPVLFTLIRTKTETFTFQQN